MQRRHSARAVILNKQDAVLLLKFSFAGIRDSLNENITEFWVTPGGGLEKNENDEEALRRELREELGLHVTEDLLWIWAREIELGRDGGRFLSHDRYFLLKTERDTLDFSRMTNPEKSSLKGVKWWSLNELASSSKACRPAGLLKELQRLHGMKHDGKPVFVD